MPFYIQQLCILLGYSPQAYHKHNKKQFLEHFNEGLILHEIDAVKKGLSGAVPTIIDKLLKPAVITKEIAPFIHTIIFKNKYFT